MAKKKKFDRAAIEQEKQKLAKDRDALTKTLPAWESILRGRVDCPIPKITIDRRCNDGRECNPRLIHYMCVSDKGRTIKRSLGRKFKYAYYGIAAYNNMQEIINRICAINLRLLLIAKEEYEEEKRAEEAALFGEI